MRLTGGPLRESGPLYALAGTLLLAGPVWHYLYVHHYPFRAEIPLLVATAATAGVAIASAARHIGGLVGTACYAALLFLFVDVQFDLNAQFHPVVLALLAVGLSSLLVSKRAAITSVALGAFYLSALPQDGGRRPGYVTAAGDSFSSRAQYRALKISNPPVLLHVILDEQWGINGLQVAGDTSTATYLRDFYERYGFALYPFAYSRFEYTSESIPSLLSLGLQPVVEKVTADTWRLRENPYFELLRAEGYAIQVFQTTFLDYCRAENASVASCETQAGNSIRNIGYLEGSSFVRGMLAGRYLLNVTSRVYRKLVKDPVAWRRSNAGGGLLALRHLRASITARPPEPTAYFVHVLLPHRPIEVDAECAPIVNPHDRVNYENARHTSDSAWTAVLALEGGQIRCAHAALGSVLDALDRVIGRDSSIVLVHGDHGSRLFQHRADTLGPNALDALQLSGRYSTLLALRRPHGRASDEPTPVPVQDFLWRLARQRFAGPVSTEFSQFVRSGRMDRVKTDSIRHMSADSAAWKQ